MNVNISGSRRSSRTSSKCFHHVTWYSLYSSYFLCLRFYYETFRLNFTHESINLMHTYFTGTTWTRRPPRTSSKYNLFFASFSLICVGMRFKDVLCLFMYSVLILNQTSSYHFSGRLRHRWPHHSCEFAHYLIHNYNHVFFICIFLL